MRPPATGSRMLPQQMPVSPVRPAFAVPPWAAEGEVSSPGVVVAAAVPTTQPPVMYGYNDTVRQVRVDLVKEVAGRGCDPPSGRVPPLDITQLVMEQPVIKSTTSATQTATPNDVTTQTEEAQPQDDVILLPIADHVSEAGTDCSSHSTIVAYGTPKTGMKTAWDLFVAMEEKIREEATHHHHKQISPRREVVLSAVPGPPPPPPPQQVAAQSFEPEERVADVYRAPQVERRGRRAQVMLGEWRDSRGATFVLTPPMKGKPWLCFFVLSEVGLEEPLPVSHAAWQQPTENGRRIAMPVNQTTHPRAVLLPPFDITKLVTSDSRGNTLTFEHDRQNPRAVSLTFLAVDGKRSTSRTLHPAADDN